MLITFLLFHSNYIFYIKYKHMYISNYIILYKIKINAT